MYAFLGFVPYDKAKRGDFDPALVVARNINYAGSEFVVHVFGDGVPAVVNDITDDTARHLIASMSGRIDIKSSKRQKKGVHRYLKGFMLWYECDIYARPQGRVLLAGVLPNRGVTGNPEPVERLLSRQMAAVPSHEELPVCKPALSQVTRTTEKKKEKERDEELVC